MVVPQSPPNPHPEFNSCGPGHLVRAGEPESLRTMGEGSAL